MTFSGAVDVTGAPQLEIDVGGTPKTLSYSSGTNSAELVFTGYTVAEGDEDADGISVGADKLTLNGGAIKKAGDTVNAVLTHVAVAADAGHKVDGVRPRLVRSQVATFGTIVLFWSEQLDHLASVPKSAFSITVSVGPEAVVSSVFLTENMVISDLKESLGPTAHTRLSYTTPTGADEDPVRDLAGNAAEDFTGRTVGNSYLRPAGPTGARVTPGPRSLEVSWNAVSRADGYIVRWKSGDQLYDIVTGGLDRSVDVPGGNTTRYTISNLVPGTAYDVQVYAVSTLGGEGKNSNEVTGTPLDAAVSSVALTSNPGADDFYTVGDTIQATVTFNGPVDVAGGNPELELDVGGSPKAVACGAGTGVTKIVCGYTVAANDTDTDGVGDRGEQAFPERRHHPSRPARSTTPS